MMVSPKSMIKEMEKNEEEENKTVWDRIDETLEVVLYLMSAKDDAMAGYRLRSLYELIKQAKEEAHA